MTQESVSDELLQQYSDVLIECDMRKMVRELIALRAQMREWQPIETAPKDGAEILVWYRRHSFFIAHWHKANKYRPASWRSGLEIFENLDLTHWMPLPAAPDKSAGET